MIHSHHADVSQVINAGISLMHNLTHSPQHLLDLAFKDIFLRHELQLHHVGLLVPLCSHADISSSIEAHGFKVLSVFPSAVVAAQLSKRFDKQVRVDIYRSSPTNGGIPTLEVFRVVDGLDAGDVHAVMPDVLHVAYAPNASIDVGTLCEKITADGFEYAGGGVNYDDVKLNCDGVTVLYFLNRQLIEEVPKIELVLHGAHSLSSISEAAISFRSAGAGGVLTDGASLSLNRTTAPGSTGEEV